MSMEHSHEIAHLRSDGGWCSFRPIVVNPLDSVRTITIFECSCPLTVRLVTRTRPPEGESSRQPDRPRRETPG